MSEGQSSVENYLDRKELAELERINREGKTGPPTLRNSAGKLSGRAYQESDDEADTYNSQEFIGKHNLGRVVKEQTDEAAEALDFRAKVRAFRDGIYTPETDEERDEIESFIDDGSEIYDDPAEEAVEHDRYYEMAMEHDRRLKHTAPEEPEPKYTQPEQQSTYIHPEHYEVSPDPEDADITEATKTAVVSSKSRKNNTSLWESRKVNAIGKHDSNRNKQGRRASLTKGGSRSEPLRGGVRDFDVIQRREQLEVAVRSHDDYEFPEIKDVESTDEVENEETILRRVKEREDEYLNWWKSQHGEGTLPDEVKEKQEHLSTANEQAAKKEREELARQRLENGIQTAIYHFGNKLSTGLMQDGVDRKMDKESLFTLPRNFVKAAKAIKIGDFAGTLGLKGYSESEVKQIQEAVFGNEKFKPLVDAIHSLPLNGHHGIPLGNGEANLYYNSPSDTFIVRPTRRGRIREVRDAMANGGLASLFPESK